MRLALALAPVVALALSSALALEPAGAGPCAALAGLSEATPRATRVQLLWGAAPARAAAALLRAVLLQAGYEPGAVALRHEPAASRLCALLAWSSSASDAPLPVRVAVAAAWAPGDSCALGGAALRVQGDGAAPAAPLLLERLAPAADPACAGLRSWDFYRNATALRECGFLRNATENATVYVPAGEWRRETEELRSRLAGARLRFEDASRADLARLVRESARAFLLLDAALWEEGGVRPAPGAPLRSAPAFSVADERALRTRAPALFNLLPRFAPAASDLRRVLEAGLDAEEAACELVANPPRNLSAWQAAAATLFRHRALAVVCEAEGAEDLAKYRFAAENSQPYLYNLTRAVGVSIEVEVVSTACGEPSRLVRRLLDDEANGALAGTVGAALPAALAAAVAPVAAELRLPLVAYEPTDEGGSAGRPERLAEGVRQLLDACGWARVGLLADGSRAAAALGAALRARGGLRLREARAATPADAARAVAELASARVDARVVVVTAGAAVAERALAAALRLGLTPEAGFAWVVREYGAADEAAAALRPYSVSAQWRGGEEGSGLRAELERRWRAHAWPRHAAPLLDALLTLAEGFRRRVLQQPALRDYALEDGGPSSFWDQIRDTSVPGVIEQLRYDARGVAQPRVALSRWGGASRPLHLTLAGGACPDPAPPPDGRARCLAPAGDPFAPSCRDGAWAGALVALALAGAALSVGAAAARRALARRDRRVRERVAAHMLASRERSFAALAGHLVDPAALELRHELGAGWYGVVRLGVLHDRRRRRVVVAAKGLREGAPPDEEARFLREACTLAALRHERIVRFEGVCVAAGPPLLLMEHAFFGDLLRYLRARRHLAEGADGAPEPGAAGPEEAAHVSAEALTRLAREAAEALAHLARRRLVHRDVRAANCLVDARRSLKLADFGLARATGEADGEYTCRRPAFVPVRWMAPESLAGGVSSSASDVWAFGVLALELVTLGAQPHGATPPAAVVRAVLAGDSAPLPRAACAETRALALACWQRAPAARPSAAQLAAWLARRRLALRPALAPRCDAPDADSGFGEPPGAP